MRRYFGTDGVRGKVGNPPITPDFVMRLGWAAGRVLAQRANRRPFEGANTILIGKDTRVSGYMLEAALQAGLIAGGMDVFLLGPTPTPGVAYLTRALRVCAGIVISASHNPYDDNGIKFFGGQGTKLSDAMEEEIEAYLEEPFRTLPSARLGKARRLTDAAGRYIEFCKSTFPQEKTLSGFKIVVDCAHGAAYHIAPHVFHELGAEVIAKGVEPNGFNINDNCGATSAQAIQRWTQEEEADFGVALDGDGDRVVMVDRSGEIYDGDVLLYAIAKDWKEKGVLTGGVVGTEVSRLGLEESLVEMGIKFFRARVGDRYVLEALHTQGWILGGETSGHVLCLSRHTTGDGIVAALQVFCAILRDPQALAKAKKTVDRYFRKSADIPLLDRSRTKLPKATPLPTGVKRLSIRPSGTEPVLRVLVEGEDKDACLALLESLRIPLSRTSL